MSYSLSEYQVHSKRLISSGETLLESLEDSNMDRDLAIKDLEASTAAEGAPARLRLTAADPGAGAVTPAVKADGSLSALLFDLQSANMLMSAGIAVNEQTTKPSKQFLKESIEQIEDSHKDMTAVLAPGARFGFAPPAKPSGSVDDALAQFRDNSEKALTVITDGTQSIVESVIDRLQSIEGLKVMEAIEQLGQSFEVVKTAGTLIGQGLTRLKMVLDRLSKLVAPGALAGIKAKLQEIWTKFTSGIYTKDALRWTLGTSGVEARVAEISALKGLTINTLDAASLNLATLDDDYQKTAKLLKNLVAGLVVAMGILAFLNVVGPWAAVAGGAAYVAILGAAVLVGMDYTGSVNVFGSTRGVQEIVEAVKPTGA